MNLLMRCKRYVTTLGMGALSAKKVGLKMTQSQVHEGNLRPVGLVHKQGFRKGKSFQVCSNP